MKSNLSAVAPRVLRESSNGYTFLSLEDAMLQKRRLYLTGEVNSQSMDILIKALLQLYQESSQEEITLYINSPGGELQSGLAAYDIIKSMHLPVHTVCLGMCASMGSILFLSGEKRSILPHSTLMVHNPFLGERSFSGMNHQALQSTLENLHKSQNTLRDIIVQATGLSAKTVERQMASTTYLSAQEALAQGYATHLLTSL